MPLGKFWRSSPLVPRCQVLWGSAKPNREPGRLFDAGVVEHLVALGPLGEGAPQCRWQPGERLDESITDTPSSLATLDAPMKSRSVGRAISGRS